MSTFMPYTPARTELEARRWAALASAPVLTQEAWVREDVQTAAGLTSAMRSPMDPYVRERLEHLRDALIREAEFLQAVLDHKVAPASRVLRALEDRPCPFCHAEPGKPCKTPGGLTLSEGPPQSRTWLPVHRTRLTDAELELLTGDIRRGKPNPKFHLCEEAGEHLRTERHTAAECTQEKRS